MRTYLLYLNEARFFSKDTRSGVGVKPTHIVGGIAALKPFPKRAMNPGKQGHFVAAYITHVKFRTNFRSISKLYNKYERNQECRILLLDKLVTININPFTFRSGAVDRSGDRMLFGGHGVRHVLLHRCVNQRIQAVSCQALKTIASIKKIIFGFYMALIISNTSIN